MKDRNHRITWRRPLLRRLCQEEPQELVVVYEVHVHQTSRYDHHPRSTRPAKCRRRYRPFVKAETVVPTGRLLASPYLKGCAAGVEDGWRQLRTTAAV